MSGIKKLIVWACVIGAVYFLLSTHIIFIGSGAQFLKKSKMTLEYTLFSAKGKTNEAILAIDPLREAGIGKLLVASGKLSEDDLESLTEKIEEAKKQRK
jgi:hypothetical protein